MKKLPFKSKLSLQRELQSEILYKKLIEHMNEAVWVGDEHERTVYANPKFCGRLGYALEEILGKESYEFWDEESAERVRNVNMTKRKKGISSSYEGNLLTKSGMTIPVLLSGTSLPNGGTIGIMTDLSEMKKKESLYKKLVENMNEAVWMGDKNERTIYANPKFCQMMGYSLEEMIGKKSYEFWDEESVERVRHVNMAKRKKGISSSYEGSLLTRFEKHIPVLVSGTPLSDGGSIGIITDLTELKQKEKQEKILNSAIQYATDAIIIFNKDGEIHTWNKGAKIIFGYKKDEILGHSLEKIFVKQNFDELLQRSSVLYNVELEGIHKNHRHMNISATLTPILGEDKKDVSFCLLIARDITSQMKFEEEIALKYQKLKDAYNKFGVLRRQMDYLFEILDLFSSHADKKSIADYIVSSVIMLTHVDACVLRMYNPKQDTLELLSCFGVAEDWKGKAGIAYKNSLVEKAFMKKTPLKIIDVIKEPKYHSAHLAKKNNLCSLLLIPLELHGKLVGSLSLYASPEKKLEIFENEFIEKYAKLIALVV